MAPHPPPAPEQIVAAAGLPERQLGYKHAKYLQRIEARTTLAGLYDGRGGYWEDSNDYEWYAGI
jgi:hypothetical protein